MVDIARVREKLDIDLLEKAKLEMEIAELVSKLALNKARVAKLTSKINEVEGNCYYVYIVFVNGIPKYIGKGKGDRFKHAVSGTSSVPELNRDFFNDEHIEVRLLYGNKTFNEKRALSSEKDCIGSVMHFYDIYNKSLPKEGDYDYMDCDLYEVSDFAISNKSYKFIMDDPYNE